MATTNKGRKIYVCATPQPVDLTQEQFEALVWVEVRNVGGVGESGTNTNIVSYDELATDVTQKNKGIGNAGDPTIECARNPTDPGQILLRSMGIPTNKNNYAFKFVDNDAPSTDYVGTHHYNRGVVTGPTRPNGRNEDFILEVFTLGLSQVEIVVNPEPQVITANVLRPSISGAAVQTGVLLTAIPGTWTNGPVTATYQWQADDAGDGNFVNISGATGPTFIPVVGNVGDALRVAETAVNGEGTPVTAYSLPTALQIAA